MSAGYYYPSSLEEIEIDGELEEVIKTVAKFDFPVVHINTGGKKFYFNTAAAQHIHSSAFRISFSTEYIVFTPANEKTRNAYSLTKNRHSTGLFMTLPIALQDKKIKSGVFKLYKYKDGLCFKRYEPLEVPNG